MEGNRMRNATILIVEDDAILAINLRIMISLMGYTVVGPLATGELAVKFLSKNSVDLVLMDIALAGSMNGIAAAEIISRTSDVPIVFLTGYSQDPMLEQAKIAAPYGYLIKPVPERELAATLDMALHRHMLDRELAKRNQQLSLLKQELSEKVAQLESTLSYVKRLEGILPVCVYCKNIRDDTGTEPGQGEWMRMEEYLHHKSGTAVSHGCCPECFEKHIDDD
jgi:DNA-binding NarL/FixJ family response regulator